MNLQKAYLTILATIALLPAWATDLKLSSPNKNIVVEVSLNEKIYYTVSFKGERVLEASPLTLSIDNSVLGSNPKLLNVVPSTVDEKIATVYGSRKEIRDTYNQLSINFEGGFSVEFRSYNNGVAYRFVTQLKEKQVTVKNEEVAFRFNFGVSAWLLDSKSYETCYKNFHLDVQAITNFNNTKNKIYLPMIVQSTKKVKVAITEAGLYDYPSLFLDRGNDYENFLVGTFEKYALSTKTSGFSGE